MEGVQDPMMKRIAIVWKTGHVTGRIQLSNEAAFQGRMAKGEGNFTAADGAFAFQGEGRLELTIEDDAVRDGNPMLVRVETSVHSFSFFVKDADALYPIYIPAYQVAVTT